MDNFLFYLVSGICIGAITALVAVGYTLVYGIIKLINFAHGEFYMVGAYAGFGIYLLLPAGLSPWLSIPVILLVSGLAGAAIAAVTEAVAYKPIRKNGRLAALLTAIGVSLLLQNLFTFVKNAQPLQYPSSISGSVGEICQRTIVVGGSGITTIRFIYVLVAVLFCVALWFIVMRTRFGRAMRAVSQDADAAALMGIDIDSVIRRTFVLGGFMAGVAGSLIAFQALIEPFMGFMPGLKAFIAAVLGGIGNIPGAIIGGFLLGIIENLAVWLGVPTGYKDVAAFVILIVVLVVKPTGIMGKREYEKV
ncbi:MAG: branched-chain amino acid ABC transporter permease [Verrucomicrobia bacterium]|nr:branched-chain amino acid ABC transporter permease [Verrucomicrobiota bacterium]